MSELIRAALVIARRDLAATVLTRSFILFLFAPLFPVIVGMIFGGLTISAARSLDNRLVAVVADADEFAALEAARTRLSDAFPTSPHLQLLRIKPKPDERALVQRVLASEKLNVAAVLHGGLDSPRLSSTLPPSERITRQVQLLVDHARAARGPPSRPVLVSVAQCPVNAYQADQPILAQVVQGLLFVLTILLATMILSQLIEEKSSKVIEVLAAAVPVESIFLGKLLAMLAVSFLGIAVWGFGGASAFALFGGGLSAIPPPAVGWPLFIAFALLYFAMAYLLLGAVFLGIGAHASTARQVQTLSMPVTMAQIAVFAVAALAVGEPDSTAGIAAAAFPLSSPYAMVARAAQLPEFWPHAAAIAWQVLWVALILRVAARLFRRSVLKSGPVRATRQRKATA